MHTRRTILKAAALAGTALFVPSGLLDAADEGAVSLGADGRRIRPARLLMTRSLLKSHVGTRFTAQTAGGNTVSLRLVEVADLPNAAVAGMEGAEGSFAARFKNASGLLLSQGTYRLEHADLGPVWFFLVPVGQPSDRVQTYEAIFNNPASLPTPPTRRPRAGLGRQLKTAS